MSLLEAQVAKELLAMKTPASLQIISPIVSPAATKLLQDASFRQASNAISKPEENVLSCLDAMASNPVGLLLSNCKDVDGSVRSGTLPGVYTVQEELTRRILAQAIQEQRLAEASTSHVSLQQAALHLPFNIEPPHQNGTLRPEATSPFADMERMMQVQQLSQNNLGRVVQSLLLTQDPQERTTISSTVGRLNEGLLLERRTLEQARLAQIIRTMQP